jgi:GT2 family glycosyltransferase
MRRPLAREITLIMKTFQRPRTAALAVEHARRRYPDLRLLVADDGAQEHAFEHPGAEVVRLPFDCGISRGRNELLARVQTPYFVLMDDDHCMSRQTRLGRMLAILERERYDILACHVWLRRPTQRLFPKRVLNGFFLDLELEDGTLTMRDAPARGSHRACDAVENFFLARTQRVRELGGWDERLKLAEHLDFFLRARSAGLRVGYTTRAGVDHVRISAERNSPHYLPWRAGREAAFRRLYLATHGIRRVVARDGVARSAEDWIRHADWGGNEGTSAEESRASLSIE